MEGFIIFLAIIWSILCFILFIKIWIMTNHVSNIKDTLSNIAQKLNINKNFDENTEALKRKIPKDYDKRLESIQIGDKVRIKESGNIVSVENIGSNNWEGHLFCKIKGKGFKWLPYDELEYVE